MIESRQRSLVAVLACRNDGSRLYGKPLQNLCLRTETSILEYQISNLRKVEQIQNIVLAISERSSNHNYIDFARKHNLPYGIGNDVDVLGRILSSLANIDCTDVFRVTTESPFTDLTQIGAIWEKHLSREFDASFYDNIIDGCGFEIITKEALEVSHAKGSTRHRSEMCTLFIRENIADFRVNRINAPEELNRRDLRLTVDYPEDLIVCRAIFEYFDLNQNMYSLPEIVKFLEKNPNLIDLIRPYSDAGYETMYL